MRIKITSDIKEMKVSIKKQENHIPSFLTFKSTSMKA